MFLSSPDALQYVSHDSMMTIYSVLFDSHPDTLLKTVSTYCSICFTEMCRNTLVSNFIKLDYVV